VTQHPEQHHAIRKTAKEHVKFTVRTWPLSDLTKLSSDIQNAIDEIFAFINYISAKEISELIEIARTLPPLDPSQSRKAREQAQARAAKQEKKATDRARSRNKPPSP